MLRITTGSCSLKSSCFPCGFISPTAAEPAGTQARKIIIFFIRTSSFFWDNQFTCHCDLHKLTFPNALWKDREFNHQFNPFQDYLGLGSCTWDKTFCILLNIFGTSSKCVTQHWSTHVFSCAWYFVSSDCVVFGSTLSWILSWHCCAHRPRRS